MPQIANPSLPIKDAVVQVRRLDASEAFAFDLVANQAARLEIAALLDFSEVKKARLSGKLIPVGRTDWEMRAKLGATVVQPCIITSQPVTTRIDQPVRRLFLRDYTFDTTGDEHEFDGDDETEPLPAEIDLAQILIESLALAAPDYPRAPGAKLSQTEFAAPGVTPLSDEDVKPFAGLAALRDKMKK